MSKEPNFEGHEHRECGEHRTVGPHRAWCYDCEEWCYPSWPCVRCQLPSIKNHLAIADQLLWRAWIVLANVTAGKGEESERREWYEAVHQWRRVKDGLERAW